MTALYELAFSFAANKEFEKSLAAATRGAEYQSDLLPMFYDLIGAAYDSMGDPQKAIDAYKKGHSDRAERRDAALQHGRHVPREPEES